MANAPVHTDLLNTMEWRLIGPHRGGRVVAVTGDVSNPGVFYFGACAGGVWKTTDGGTYWENVSDGFLNTAAVGAIAAAESDPNVVYAGMGESCIRGNACHGDGVYGTNDGGKTWSHLGLRDTRHIARVRVHPSDANLVYVAALGDPFGPSVARGVYRSKDGGKSWQHVLSRGQRTGAADLAMSYSNPRILFAAMWETRRTPWSLESGGPGSGIFKSTDGGDTWTDISDNAGLPKGIKGRIGVAVSPAKPNRVWAVIEAEESGLFRSDDGGESWQLVSEDRNLLTRPWYYNHVFADPQDPDTLYILNLAGWKSTDGGKTFNQLTTPHGDNHDLWIDPNNPQRMIEGNDGGACVSFNGGDTWSTIYNQPTAQFYHVDTDSNFPYRVYGTQQDNTAMSVPSRSHKGAIPYSDCYQVGTSESGHIAVRPDNSDIVYSGAIGSSPGGGGSLLRYDHSSGQVRSVTVWPEVTSGHGARAARYRFQWTFPILISPHDPNVLFTAGNHLFKSTDDGTSWECLSPDLTRNDDSKMGPSGGPLTKDDTGAEFYGTIFAFAESPLKAGLFWAGSDDGLVHVSQDGGATWDNVTPTDLPPWALVSTIEPSRYNPAAAYLVATRYKWADHSPYIYRTDDYGQSWTAIVNGIPNEAFTRVVREDPARQGLLYAGTESGAYVSFDNGDSWQSLQSNLPVTPVHDLAVKEQDLVAATHGRSFWILDDLTPLHQMKDGIDAGTHHLFQPRAAYRYLTSTGAERPGGPGKNYTLASGVIVTFYESKISEDRSEKVFLDAGKNPPAGVVVNYYLKDTPSEEVSLAFLDADDREIRRFSSNGDSDGPKVAANTGVNRFVWDMRYPPAAKVEGDTSTEKSLDGPVAAPGVYKVRLTTNGYSAVQQFEVRKDPRVHATQEELETQFDLLIKIRDKLSETQEAINTIRTLKGQLAGWKNHPAAPTSVVDAAGGLEEKLSAVEEELIQPKGSAPLDRVNFPTRLNVKIASLTSVVASADAVPTRQSYDVYQDISGRIGVQVERLQQVTDEDVSAFNNLVQDLGLPAVAS